MDHGGHGGHHDGAHGGGGHSHPATFIVNFSHGGTHGPHTTYAYAFAHLGSFGHSGTNPAAQGVTKGFPKVGEDSQPLSGYEVHVSRHGEASLLKQIIDFCGKANLVDITNMPGLDGGSKPPVGEILPWDAWNPETNGNDMPSGYYPHASGTTTLAQWYWQIGTRKNPLRTWDSPEYDPKSRTYLDVRVCTWRYYETGDYESRIDIRIITAPMWDHKVQAYGYKRTEFERHQNAAIFVATKVLELLKKCAPSPAAVALRTWVEARQSEPQAPSNHPDGVYDEDQATMEAEDRDRVQQEYETDQQVVDDVSAVIPSLPAPSAPAPAAPGTTNVDLELGETD